MTDDKTNMNRRQALQTALGLGASAATEGAPPTNAAVAPALIEKAISSEAYGVFKALEVIGKLKKNPASEAIKRIHESNPNIDLYTLLETTAKEAIATIRTFVDTFQPYKKGGDVIDLETNRVKTSLDELRKLLEKSPEELASETVSASQQAVQNYQTIKNWLETTPAHTQEPCDDFYSTRAEEMLSQMATWSSRGFGSDQVTQALTLPDNDPKKYELLSSAFNGEAYGELFDPSAVAPPDLQHLYQTESSYRKSTSQLTPTKSPSNLSVEEREEAIKKVRKLLHLQRVEYSPVSDVYITDILATRKNLAYFKVLFEKAPEALNSLKIMHHDGTEEDYRSMKFSPKSLPSSLVGKFSGTIVFGEKALLHLADLLPIVAAANALSQQQNAASR